MLVKPALSEASTSRATRHLINAERERAWTPSDAAASQNAYLAAFLSGEITQLGMKEPLEEPAVAAGFKTNGVVEIEVSACRPQPEVKAYVGEEGRDPIDATHSCQAKYWLICVCASLKCSNTALNLTK